MDLTPARYADIVVITPTGRINHTNAESFERALAPEVAECSLNGYKLVFDLSHLEYVSSAGLRIFMLASKKLLPGGNAMAVAAPQTVVREILEISRFNLVFPIYASLDDALTALSATAAQAYHA